MGFIIRVKSNRCKNLAVEEIFIQNLKTFRDWMSHWVSGLQSKHLLLLSGPMGVGKTQFVRFLVEALEEREGRSGDKVFSPSFTIHNLYKVGQILISHVDLYRLKVEEELYSVGFSDIFQSSCVIVVIEWSEHLSESFFPLDWRVTKIRMEIVEEEIFRGQLGGERQRSSHLSLENVQSEKRKLWIHSLS